MAQGILAHGGVLGAALGSVFDPSVPESKIRTNGLVLGGIGLLLLVLNLITIFALSRYYFYAAMLVPVSLCTGGYMVVLGRPTDQQTGQPATWWKIGLLIVAGGSLVVGIALAWWLGH